MSTRLLRILTESNSTSNPVLVSGCVISGADYCASLQSQISPVIPTIGFRLRHFRCKEFYLLVLWIWNQNIAIATIVGTLSHINLKEKYEICKNVDVEGTLSSFIYFKT
jgi:hypothetical protein